MSPIKKYAGILGIMIIAAGSLLLLSNQEGIGKMVHAASHDAGICSGESCSPGDVIEQISGNAACAPGSASCDLPAQANSKNNLSKDEEKVIKYIANIIATENRVKFEEGEIEKATGVSSDILEDEMRLQAAVMAELNRRSFSFQNIACAGNCETFSACSIDRNLNGATGEELARYKAEKDEDGKTYANFSAPAFTLPMTDGEKISLTNYQGKAFAMITLSVHCYHSMETLPLLTKLKKQFESQGLAILPVFVNTNSVEDIQTSIAGFELDFPVGVAEGRTLSEAFNSRMVPSTFLIDAQGNITKKLVGQKDESTLAQAFDELLKISSPVIGMADH